MYWPIKKVISTKEFSNICIMFFKYKSIKSEINTKQIIKCNFRNKGNAAK